MKQSLLILLLYFCAAIVQAQERFSFDHGPYLQDMADGGMTVVFTTSRPAISWIEVKNGETDVRKVFTARYGLKEANNLRNAVRVDGLASATAYSYRLCSKEILKFEPYKVTYGDSIVSPWYVVNTPDLQKEQSTFLILNDIHGNIERMDKLIGLAGIGDVDLVWLNGDAVSYLKTPDQPYGVIDKCVEKFATEKPFIAVRGNHETRGAYARTVSDFYPRRDGKFYFTYTVGKTMFVVLDSGEDKPDGNKEYSGCVAFDGYRAEQTAWLADVLKSKAYRKAEHRIVVVHIPPVNCTGYAVDEINRLWMPLLNKANVDLMICGHTHRYSFAGKNEQGNQFPILINSNDSFVKMTVGKDGIHYRVVDENGKELLNR